MKIPLKNKPGEIVAYATIDSGDLPLVGHISWSMSKADYPYAIGNIKVGKTWKTGVRMHRLILGAQPGQMIDHINGNCLDNRRKNLRFCNKSQNGTNSKLPKNSTSGYKGVTYYKRYEQYGTPWMAQIGFNWKHTTIGYFKTPKEAAVAYNKKAKEIHGDFAKLNIL